MERFATDNVRKHFDSIADQYDAGKERQSYYYETLRAIYGEVVPPGSLVLDVGCGTGTLLASVRPRRGTGLDLSPRMAELASRRHPELEFRAEDIAKPSRREPYEYVMLSDVIEHLPDLDAALEGLKSYGDAQTRYVVTCANPLWAPVLHSAETLGLKLPEGDHEWIGAKDLIALTAKHGYALLRLGGRMLAPKKVPLLSAALNALSRWPPLRPLCLIQVLIFRLGSHPNI